MKPIIACALAGALSLSGDAQAGADQRFSVGAGGWLLERFESDVVILRTGVTAYGSRRPGLLLLSCAGTERRLRLTLPQGRALHQNTVLEEQAFRSVLIRAAGRPLPGQTPLLAGMSLEKGRILTLLEPDPGPASVVTRLAALLSARPAALDMLTHDGTGVIGLRQLTPYVLTLSFGAHDGMALDHFASACAPARR